MAKLLAWYGGTFDPIHYGHLRPLQALARQAGLERITLLPNNQPPHRQPPQASSQQRLAMLKLAIAGDALLAIDERELQRDSPSYTVDTLQQLRREYGWQQPLAFIIGMDSLHGFPHWRQPEQILACCHLLVCPRPGYARHLPGGWLAAHFSQQVSDLHQSAAGKIFIADTPLYPVSASDIRNRRRQHLPCDEILPAAVLGYIEQQGLYL